MTNKRTFSKEEKLRVLKEAEEKGGKIHNRETRYLSSNLLLMEE